MSDARAVEELKTQAEATKSGIPYADTTDIVEAADTGGVLSLAQLREYQVAPLQVSGNHAIELGITAQTDRTRLPQLQQAVAHTQLTFKTISRSGFNYILNHIYYRQFQPERDGDFKAFGNKLKIAAPKDAFGLIAQLAFWLGASDIHIEPQTDSARVRFRLDGVLHPITEVATDAYKIFLSDLQTRAEIKWGSDEPQTGRISYDLMDNHAEIGRVDMRIETIPSFHGEEIVVRIFNAETRNLHLEEMGFSPPQVQRIDEVTAHPNGMMLTVGPTGSGKTSTLYAIINRLNNPETKIITLEDPVEYDIAGISQVPVKSDDKELFIEKLRAVLREDPNVIMIGEIRDVDTAKTALQAALTGHLLLSTFHATNASTAISRMLDMIGSNPLFPSAIRMIIAQRLARRICDNCAKEIPATAEEQAFLKRALATITPDRQPKINPQTVKLKKGEGCKECHGLGYKGRIAIVEMMAITPDIEKLMTAPDRTTAQDIESLAVKNGMATLLEDGLNKVLAGITTVEEIIQLEAS
ncbi:MAG TPA: GspE/PulE family protein [Candidatus Saccharimonadales bacterium]|nr:GspE/PulE family protein [Candidatus Saccharimonadales bacterium]